MPVWSRVALLLLVLASSARGDDPEVVPVFVPRQDGFASIRIPAVVVTNGGALLAFAEGRQRKADQARNRIILKRSTDGGRSWGQVTVIAEAGDRSLNNPCAVVERTTGTVLVMYQSYPAGVAERSDRIVPGYEGELVVRNWLITSLDEGQTWTSPRDITRQTKRPERVTTMAGGPGIGIQLRQGPHAGRLLMPFNEGPFGLWNIYAVYSDDRGATWSLGEVAPGALVDGANGRRTSQVNEAQLVELRDGSVRFNARRWSGQAVRKTCVSADGGQTWSKVTDVPELADPSCMASIIRQDDLADGGRTRWLFSGPQSTKRENGTVFLSTDDGETWPVKRVLCPGSFAYSCLVPLPDGTIGCLYEAEGTSQIVFVRFTLGWLTEETESKKPTRN